MALLFKLMTAVVIIGLMHAQRTYAEPDVLLQGDPTCQQPGADSTIHCLYLDARAFTLGPIYETGTAVCKQTTTDEYGTVFGQRFCQFHDRQTAQVFCANDPRKRLTVAFDQAYSYVREVSGGIGFYWQSDSTMNADGRQISTDVLADNLNVACV